MPLGIVTHEMDNSPSPISVNRVQKRWCGAQGAVDDDITSLVEDAADAIRSTIGDGPYNYAPLAPGTLEHLPNPVEALIVPLAVLAFGSAWAFATLIRHGYERESLILQRQVIEYYVRAKYFSEEPTAAFFEWLFESTSEERRFLAQHGATFGSMKRSRELDAMMTQLWSMLGGDEAVLVTEQKFTQKLREFQKERGIPTLNSEQLAQKYCLANDYGAHYALPSKISHGSQFTRGFAEYNGSLRFWSSIVNANVKAALVAEYLIELVAILQSVLTPAMEIDIAPFRKRLYAIERRYHIHRPGRKRRRQPRRRRP